MDIEKFKRLNADKIRLAELEFCQKCQINLCTANRLEDFNPCPDCERKLLAAGQARHQTQRPIPNPR